MSQSTLLRSGAIIAGMPVDATSYEKVCDQISAWIGDGLGHYIIAANTHSIVEYADSELFRETIDRADIVAPDGTPLVWCLKRAGFKEQKTTRGPDLMLEVLARAEKAGWKIGLYGGKPETLEILRAKLVEKFPKLELSYVYSPPFRTLEDEEKASIRSDIATAKVDVLFVGLGCPRQENWMAAEVPHISSVMLGVGAAFDFHAGVIKRAPPAFQHLGLEWLFRLAVDPARLWGRYSRVIPRFSFMVLRPKSIRRL